MKKFLLKCSFFIIIIIFVWGANEAFYRFVPNNYTVKNKNIVNKYDDCEVLILGNSHAFFGLNPRFFDMNTFNLSNVSQTLFFDKLLLEKHLKHFKKLKYVILTVEYTTLSHSDNHPEMQWRKYFYEAQMGLHTGQINWFDIKKYSLALVPPTSINTTSIMTYFKQGTIAQCESFGFAANIGVLSTYNNPTAAIDKMKQHEDGSLLFDRNLGRIKDIVKKCSQKGVKVILVNMPVTTYYADNVNPEKRFKIVNSCNELALENNLNYINLFQDKAFDNKDFYDVDHLNIVGAKKCSQLINQYIHSFN
ncbi:MAG: hypothetical protein DI539_18710 [Flavobacterium psychrophilum]|nr:MAG: hypothetical protein DI539_18710 [Flavobacterium psychrophilum]